VNADSRDFVGCLLVSLVLRKPYLASRLSSGDGFPDAAIPTLSWIGFEVYRIRQPVSPVETILFHYCDDALALRCEPFVTARTRGYAGHIDSEARFVDGSSGRKRAIKARVRPSATGAERTPMQLRLIIGRTPHARHTRLDACAFHITQRGLVVSGDVRIDVVLWMARKVFDRLRAFLN